MRIISRIEKKIVAILIMAFLMAGFLDGIVLKTYVYADQKVDVPNFTLKAINDGTGVKISINKNKNADGYVIFFSEIDNEYTKYLHKDGKYVFNLDEYDDYCLRKIEIPKNGTKKRSYVIKGLPAGKYSFRVYATNGPISEEKSITIKAAASEKSEKKEYDFSKTKVGDVIKFGSYEQDDDMRNGKEDIEWIVLSKDENKMLVLSKYVLDCVPMHKGIWEWEYDEYTIHYRTVHYTAINWLNEYFCKQAFSKSEQKMLSPKKINKVGRIEDTFGEETKRTNGKTMKCKVFLLSKEDMLNKDYGFSTDVENNDINRRCLATPYAVAQGVRQYDPEMWKSANWKKEYAVDGKPACLWCVLDNAYPGFSFSEIDYGGEIEQDWYYNDAGMVSLYGEGIRPALYIKLK